MTYDPTQLNDLEMLSLIAKGLIPYLEQVMAGEKNPFPYPEDLLRGFNQLCLACALRDLARAQRPKSIPEFVATWGLLPLLEWPLKLDLPVDVLMVDDRLIDSDFDGRPTIFCHQLSQTSQKIKKI